MRLLNTTTITLSYFEGDKIPPYAILSHTWGDAEVSFQDLLHKSVSELDGLAGSSKIRSCCALAAHEGYTYVWIDTCCIDKTSSAELSEAVNSMYRWYQEARVCFTYLADVRIFHKGPWCPDGGREFRESRWFTRGWTLQELLAPKHVIFYGSDWRELGSKSSLRSQISLITGIQLGHMIDISSASVAQKMSWASGRKTTRVEDIAYCLLGIFDVNMPLLYGEGKKAFTRLQHEIAKISDDESIFAWTDKDLTESGIFAQSPHAFAESANVIPIIDSHDLYVRRAPYTVTHWGLAIEIFANYSIPPTFISPAGMSFVLLNCGRQLEPGTTRIDRLAIELENISGDNFIRSSPGRLSPPMWRINLSSARLIYVRPVYVPCGSQGQQRLFFINATQTLGSGFSVLEPYGCRLERHLWDSLSKRCWKITLIELQSPATLLITYVLHGDRQIFGLALYATENDVGIDVIVPSAGQSFPNEIDWYKYNQEHFFGIEAKKESTVKFQNNRRVSVILKSEEVAPGSGKIRHFVEFADVHNDIDTNLKPNPVLQEEV